MIRLNFTINLLIVMMFFNACSVAENDNTEAVTVTVSDGAWILYSIAESASVNNVTEGEYSKTFPLGDSSTVIQFNNDTLHYYSLQHESSGDTLYNHFTTPLVIRADTLLGDDFTGIEPYESEKWATKISLSETALVLRFSHSVTDSSGTFSFSIILSFIPYTGSLPTEIMNKYSPVQYGDEVGPFI